ncbi:MAG: hypothetical protein OQK45_07410 [Sulfurovum sp.]|nr:hypothetical protein [Sulfurovum sp.]
MITKILLITFGLSVFVWADLTNNADASFKATLQDMKKQYNIEDDTPVLDKDSLSKTKNSDSFQDIKNQYNIKDETPKKSVVVDAVPVPMKKKSNTPKKVKKQTKEEIEIEKIRKELNIQGPSAKEIKVKKIREALNIQEPDVKTKKLDMIRDELNIDYAVPKNESFLDKRVEDVKESLGLDESSDISDSFDDALSSIKNTLTGKKEKPKEDFTFAGKLKDFQKTLGLDLDVSWGIPSIFGVKEKKKKSFFDSGILGDIKDTGTSFYKGAKYSGQSAQFMSGMMYNSSKMYNTMFGVFDDSPFNFFEEEEEPSLFDVFEHGNTVMDMFD